MMKQIDFIYFSGSLDVIPNAALDLALVFTIDMFAVLCSRCVELLSSDTGM